MDNGPVNHNGKVDDYMGSSQTPFRGEIGDVLQGLLRIPGIIRWLGEVPARKSNEMVAIHDFLPTFAALLGDALSNDRLIDGHDQWSCFTGESKKSATEDSLTLIDGEVSAARWRHYRIYPKQVITSSGNPSAAGIHGYRVEAMGYPARFNIARDPRERMN
ncbi:MAG: hypothetical protein VYA84_19590 [Planctomycetota bacterium]|nr:hypothetical protein [Planctomycetota bacterium]